MIAAQATSSRYDWKTARVLTLQRPWTWAITDLDKRIENRTWKPPAGVTTILIHAGLGWDNAATPFLRTLGITPPAQQDIPSSLIVAVARITGVCRDTVDRRHIPCGCGRWATAGQYHWRLGDVHVLDVSVRCKGQLGLWTPTGPILKTIQAQVR